MEYFGHSQTNKLTRSFKIPPHLMETRANPPAGKFPDRLTAKLPKKRRLAAFYVPFTYAVDAMIGYQKDEPTFSAFRVKRGTIPEGFQIVWIDIDRQKQRLYVVLEHPSFPDYTPGTVCPEIEIIIEGFDVAKPDDLDPKDDPKQLQFRIQQIYDECARDGDPENKIFTIQTLARCAQVGHVGNDKSEKATPPIGVLKPLIPYQKALVKVWKDGKLAHIYKRLPRPANHDWDSTLTSERARQILARQKK